MSSNPRHRLVNRALNPLLADLPEEFDSYRSQQIEAVAEAMDAYRRGVRCVILDAPTGSGKTLIGETIRRLLTGTDQEAPGGKVARPRTAYVCSSKSLQAQFGRDYGYGRVLYGRANYPTDKFAKRFHPGEWVGHLSCEDCNWTKARGRCDLCRGKDVCPYERAKKAAIAADLAILNGAYFLTEANGPSRFSGRHLLICDEADTLETQLMGYVEVEVSKRRMESFKWDAPKITVEADWLRWCKLVLPDIGKRAERAGRAAEESGDMKWVKESKYLNRLQTNISRIVADMESGSSFWVYTGTRDTVSFKPSRVNNYGEEMLWKHSKNYLLMSATVISADSLMFSLGWRGEQYHSIALGSTFPVTNRRVVIRPAADMSHKNDGADMGKLLAACVDICRKHPGDRILIHSVSYRLTAEIQRCLAGLFPRRPILSYASSAAREPALAEYLRKEASVLVAPSLDRGVDLPGDACRVQIIAKCPFPNLGDKVVAARFHSGPEGKVWYTVETIRKIVQMTGRAVRSKDDWAVTYILDTQFSDRVWSSSKRLFPEWWRKSVVWER